MTATPGLADKNRRNHSENRRMNKPLMEKRRRARINQSLGMLKSLIVDSTQDKTGKPTKLEKADILELTVAHLQRSQGKSEKDGDSYRLGYEECRRLTGKFLENSGMELQTVARLLSFLDSARDPGQKSDLEHPGAPLTPDSLATSTSPCPCFSPSPKDTLMDPSSSSLPKSSSMQQQQQQQHSPLAVISPAPVICYPMSTPCRQYSTANNLSDEPVDLTQPLDLCRSGHRGQILSSSVWRPW